MTTDITGAGSATAHRKRFKRMHNLLSPTSRAVRDAVVDQLLPPLETAGFRWVGCNFGEPELPASANEIILERPRQDDKVDFIWVTFEKYRRPLFQLRFGQTQGDQPRHLKFSASLVRKQTQYYHFWGIRWWMLNRRREKIVHMVAAVRALLPQVLTMLDTGVEGSNVRRPPIEAPLPGSLG